MMRAARLRRPPGGWGAAWIAALLLALLLWSVVYPNAAIVVGSFERGLGDWRDFAASPADRDALWGTILVSIGSVIGALLVGVPLAFLLTRTEFRGRRVLSGVATLPAALPPLVGVIAFLFLYGESGVVTRAVQHVLGLSSAPWTFTGLSAVVFVHAYTMYVYVFLFVSAGLERYDTTLDEAAAGLGASKAFALRRVTLPLLTPSIAGAMLLVFMSALGSFSAPYIFGGGARVLATQILVSKLNGAMGLAYVETTVLAVTAVIALLVLRRLEGRRQYSVAGKGRATRQALRSPLARLLLPPVAVLIVVLLILPHAMVVLVSFARDGAWTTQVLPPEYTLDNYRRLASESALWRPITNSVAMGTISTVANAIVCFAIAYVVVLSRAPGRRALALLSALPWAIPATAIALGLAATFDRNDPAQLRVLLVGTFWILPLAYFVRNIPLVTSAVEGSLRQMDPTLEDAARGLGASKWLTLRRVVIPAARPGLIAGTMLAGVAAVGEFVASVVLYTHASRPISVEILSQIRNTAFGTAAGYSVLLIALVLVITVGARWLEGRFIAGEGMVNAGR
ncbi:MAG TPA: iron ABC transporter permease [Gemmatimonadaceae bacterium]|jgi:iron(III) transport system permease protein|nr:iron ABC transporter permease [Gemmatimonadaceae bacterium]